MNSTQETLKQRGHSATARTLRIGANATVMTITFIGILILVNVLATRYHKRWDLTQTGEFSLSQQTIQIIQNLKQPVQIIGFFGKQDQTQQDEAASKLKEYTSRSDKISYRVVDPDVDPMTARNYEVTRYGTLVLESGTRKQHVNFPDEQSITSGILKVTQEKPTTIYFLTGHRERSLDGFERTDFSQVKRLLEQDNFMVQPINLVITDTIPLQNSVLVVADPEQPLPQHAEQIIGTYVAKGGRLMVLSNPLNPPILSGVLSAAGLSWNNDVVIDSQSELGNPLAPALIDYPFHTITKDLKGQATLFATVRTISKNSGMQPSDVTVTSFLESSQQSQAATDFAGGQVKPSPNDAKGPLSFGYSIEGVITPTTRLTDTTTTGTKARLVVIGDADFASNSYVSTPATANGTLFRNAIAWLAEQGDLIALPAKQQVDRSMFLTSGQSKFVFYSSTLGLPALILISGVVVWWRRR